jgi:hypothetical protein
MSMGYYSDFEVDVTDIPFVVDTLNAVTDYDWHDYGNGIYLGSIKWYDWLTDLAQVAKLFPEGYLRIIRYGEHSPDISAAVVTNGKVHEVKPEIVWPM